MLKIKEEIELEKLQDYGFWLWESRYGKDKEWRYCDKGTFPTKITVKENKYMSFNCPTIKTMEKFYEMIKGGLVEITHEKPPKKYAYQTKLELEQRILELEQEIKELKKGDK